MLGSECAEPAAMLDQQGRGWCLHSVTVTQMLPVAFSASSQPCLTSVPSKHSHPLCNGQSRKSRSRPVLPNRNLMQVNK